MGVIQEFLCSLEKPTYFQMYKVKVAKTYLPPAQCEPGKSRDGGWWDRTTESDVTSPLGT